VTASLWILTRFPFHPCSPWAPNPYVTIKFSNNLAHLYPSVKPPKYYIHRKKYSRKQQAVNVLKSTKQTRKIWHNVTLFCVHFIDLKL